jgi:maltose-binding protein MalE
MKHTLTILAVLSLAISAQAGCGKTTTEKGKLTAFDKDTKTLTVTVGGKEVKRKLTASSKGADTVEGLVGKKVEIVVSHNSVESVTKG